MKGAVQTGPTRKVRGPGRGGSRDHLLDTAEHLFAERGIDGVSLREIATAAGQRNNAAVAYHFGDKKGLVDALLTDRLDRIERLREARIADIADLGDCTTPELLRMLLQPTLDICAERERPWLVEFHLAYNMTGWGRDAYDGHPVVSNPGRYTASARLLDAVHRRHDHLSHMEVRQRMSLAVMTFWLAVSRHANLTGGSLAGFSLNFMLHVAVAILEAPAD